MAEHPNAAMVRRVYEAFAKDTDIAFHVPGQNQVAGTYQGDDGFSAMIAKVMQLSEATFREEVHDVLANDEHAVALAIHRLQRNGRAYEYTTAHVWHIHDGKLTELWEHPGDPQAFDEAWS